VKTGFSFLHISKFRLKSLVKHRWIGSQFLSYQRLIPVRSLSPYCDIPDSGVPMQRSQIKFLYLNSGHFLDHLFMQIFASVAAFRLISEWNMSCAELTPYATPGFVAFGVCAILTGWIADRWSREGMIVHGQIKTGIPLTINGAFGNLGVASAALLTGFLVDSAGWRSAFYLPGIVSILLGVSYLVFIKSERRKCG
jgi:sugar phosphate permease